LIGLIFCQVKNTTGQITNETAYPVFEIKWSNDIFHQTDRNFSNGFDIALYHHLFDQMASKYIMLPNNKDDYVWYGFTLTQHFFTPRELFTTEVIYTDRPYASYLLLGHQKISLNPTKNLKRTSEIQVGILGKYSGGKSLQNGIHFILPASKPAIGWDNQISPDLALMYSARIEKGLINANNFILAPYLDGKLGVPYTHMSGGLFARAGLMNNYFESLGVSKNNAWELYAFGDVNSRYVLYNGVLEGGLFNPSIHTMNNINPWVFTLSAGIAFSVKSFSLEYGSVLISQEYETGMGYKWGYLSLKFAI
jgi:hypothetical protein